MISQDEAILIEIVRVNTKERAALYLEDYIQRYGFLSDEVGDIVKKILKKKDSESKPDAIPVTEIEEIIKEIQELPDIIYGNSIMDVKGISWKCMRDRVIEIINAHVK